MKSARCLTGFVLVILGTMALPSACTGEGPRKTRNVLFVMTDGLRWQEVFAGAAEPLLHKPGDKNAAACDQAFWRTSPEARRETLLPFVWSVMAKQGQIYGNCSKGSEARLANGLKFSYPGYQEVLCGYPDPRIDRNDAPPNPNVTVLEWLHGKPAYRGRVAAFGAWDAFDRIINRDRCGFPVNAGFAPLLTDKPSPTVELLNQLKREIPRHWDGEPVDALTFHTAFEYFKTAKPRILYLSLGETDEWGHAGQYGRYLTAARRADQYVKTLWETAQSMPEYQGTTTLILATDHGRGNGLTDWKDHGAKVNGAEFIWMGFLGPDTPPLGERSNVQGVTLAQVAATLAACLGEDYHAAVPKAGKPIAEVLGARE